MPIHVQAFYDKDTGTGTYVVHDTVSREAVIIDPVLHLNLAAGKVSSELADAQLAWIDKQQLHLRYICDTHAHADHLSAAAYLKQQTGAKTVISQGIGRTQAHFASLFNKAPEADLTRLYDVLVDAGDTLMLGKTPIDIMATPGHTPDSVSYRISNNLFVGDTLFMPDVGTARCDFPGGDAALLYQSISRIHQLADDTRLWFCHDYPPASRGPVLSTTVADSRQNNIHVNNSVSEAEFVQRRTLRDRQLAVPRLLYPSLQINLWGAQLPSPASNGRRYLSIPLEPTFTEEPN